MESRIQWVHRGQQGPRLTITILMYFPCTKSSLKFLKLKVEILLICGVQTEFKILLFLNIKVLCRKNPINSMAHFQRELGLKSPQFNAIHSIQSYFKKLCNISLTLNLWEPNMPRKIFKHETVKLQSHYFLDSKGQYYLHIRNTVIGFTEIKLKI